MSLSQAGTGVAVPVAVGLGRILPAAGLSFSSGAAAGPQAGSRQGRSSGALRGRDALW